MFKHVYWPSLLMSSDIVDDDNAQMTKRLIDTSTVSKTGTYWHKSYLKIKLWMEVKCI